MGDDPFTLRQLDHDLENVWLALREEQFRTAEFNKAMTKIGTLNSVAIVFLCVAVLIMFYVMQKEIMPMIESRKS